METHPDSVPVELWIDQMPRDEAEETLKRLLQNSPGFFYHGKNDRDRTMQVLSGHFKSITGFAPDELVGDGGLQYNDLIAQDDLERVHEAIERGLENDGRFEVSYRIETADEQTCWLLEYGRGIDREDGAYTHVEGFVSDVTHEKTLEHRLRHSQKLEVIGRIAGEVAHDFNNLLSVILGYGSLALEELEDFDDDHPACKDLYDVIEAADRAKELSGQLLSFSRYQASAPEVIEVDSFLRNKISMVARALVADIQIDQHLDAGKSRIEIEETQLEQVLLNLATNAQDAMEDQPGTLRIVSHTTTFDERDLPARNLETSGEYVVIEFQDQGHGIPPEVRDKIFEPYFTTKSRDKGTGLGLATSCGIVASVGGGIWFDTEVDEGTTFYVALPTTTREPTASRPRKGILEGRRAKVLVVENDTKVRDLVARLLRSRDINTITAEGAAGARRLWSSEGGFDLIIADIILPETNGIELVNELLEPSDNDVPVLFLSGYTGEVLDKSNVVPNQVRFFKKPFTPDILRQAVVEMLGLEDGRHED